MDTHVLLWLAGDSKNLSTKVVDLILDANKDKWTSLMSDTVIRVENLGKKYIIGHQKQERYTSLRDVIADGVQSVFSSLTQNSNKI